MTHMQFGSEYYEERIWPLQKSTKRFRSAEQTDRPVYKKKRINTTRPNSKYFHKNDPIMHALYQCCPNGSSLRSIFLLNQDFFRWWMAVLDFVQQYYITN